MIRAALKVSLTFLCLVIISIGCKESRKENLYIDKALGRNLMFASERVHQNTISMVQSFRNYSSDPGVSEKTNPMLDRMELVGKISSSTLEYLNDLKRILKIEADIKLINLKETFDENDYDAVTTIFKNQKKGTEVFRALVKFQADIQQVNSELSVLLESPFYFFDSFSIPKEKLEEKFTSIYFDNLNTVSALAVIAKFENDVRNYENMAVSFFFTKVAIHSPVMTN